MQNYRLYEVRRDSRRMIAAVVCLFVALGGLWIVLSNLAVDSLSPELREPVLRYRAVVYVAATTMAAALLLRWVQNRTLKTLAQAEANDRSLRHLFDNHPRPMWFHDAETHAFVHVNDAALRAYGKSREWFETHKLSDLVLREDQAGFLRAMRQAGDGGQVIGVFRHLTRADAVRYMRHTAQAVRFKQRASVMVTTEDVTELTEQVAEHESINAKLESLVAERTRELAEANDELRAFSHTAAHDLKSPLHGIAGMGYLLRTSYSTALGREGTEMARHIERAAREMSELVNDLLRLSNVSNAKPEVAPTDLVPMAHAILEDLRVQEPHRQVRMEMPRQLVVPCDAGLMRSLLLNLLGNAWKFSAGRKLAVLEMSCRSLPDGIEVSIRDNGAGFDMARAERLFKPFQRLHTEMEFKGTGLGLVTCQRIVRKHGGAIRIESKSGEGTQVSFTLPLQGVTDPVEDSAARGGAAS